MLEALHSPKSVAVIGASRKPGKVGFEVVKNLKACGFEGPIVPVNPTADEIEGIRCYANLKDYGQTVEHAVIVVPPKAVRQAMQDAMDCGAQALTIITAGFKEVGADGAKVEKELAEFARSRGVRMMGPNCLGLLNTHHKMNASFAHQMPNKGGISVVSQSGALCTAILDWAKGRGIGLAHLLSMGNKADLDETDFVRMFEDDEHTRVIVGYLESIEEGDQFMKTAETVAATKPIVVLKVGTTSAGTKAASSHTGSLVGTDVAYGAAFKRAGVIRAENFEHLFDVAIAFDLLPLPKGRRVAIITNAGGPGIMAADAVEKLGMSVEPLTPKIRDELKSKLAAAASVQNPIDILGDASETEYALALNAAQDDPNIDAILALLAPVAITPPPVMAKALIENNRKTKPIMACWMGHAAVMEAREALLRSGIPEYPAPERAAMALKAMCDYQDWRNRPPRIVTRFPVNRRRVERIIARQQRAGQLQVKEVKAKEILRAYDFNVPDGKLARTTDEAIAAAEQIGYPVAMKIVSPDIVHKSDLGGVKLNLGSSETVRDAFDLMMLRMSQRVPDATITGAYIEKMGPPGREVIVGMTRDRQFGPMLMFGLGGIFVEVMKDVTFHIAPITHDEAMQMLKGTRSYALLTGARGQAGVDIDAIASALQRLSQLVTDFPQIQELDINPLMVGEIGTKPLVADARMTLSSGGTK